MYKESNVSFIGVPKDPAALCIIVLFKTQKFELISHKLGRILCKTFQTELLGNGTSFFDFPAITF